MRGWLREWIALKITGMGRNSSRAIIIQQQRQKGLEFSDTPDGHGVSLGGFPKGQ